MANSAWSGSTMQRQGISGFSMTRFKVTKCWAFLVHLKLSIHHSLFAFPLDIIGRLYSVTVALARPSLFGISKQMICNTEKGPLCNLWMQFQISMSIRAFWSEHFCSSTYTTVSIDSLSRQRRPRSAADQGLCCPQTA